MKIKLLLIAYCSFVITVVSYQNECKAQTSSNLSKDSLLNELKKNSHHDTARILLLNQLAYLSNYNNPDSSLNYGFEAKWLADSMRFSKGIAEACRQIGLAFWDQGNISSSINYFLIGLRMAEANHHVQIEADITGNIGTAYNSMGNPKEALIFLVRALSLQRKLNNHVRESAVLNNIGDSYLALKKFEDAARFYKAALQSSLQNDFKIGVTTNLRNLGNVMEASGKYDSALIIYFNCIKLSSQINDNRGYILCHKSIASVYLKTNKLPQANDFAQKALSAASKSKLRVIQRDVYQLLYQISEAQNNQPNSLAYFKLYVNYKDSVQNLKVVSDVATQRLLFNGEKKQAEIDLLKKDSAFQTELITSRNQLILFGVTVFLIVTVWLLWGVRNARRAKIKNNLLTKRNEEVAEQHDQINRQHSELVTLNEELQLQRQEVLIQRDSLEEKNHEIELINHKIAEVNENLEELAKQRTKTLEAQNTKLMEYAFLNAHKLRAPLARIMGLAYLLELKSSSTEKSDIMNHLATAAEELREIVQDVSGAIQKNSGNGSSSSKSN